MTGALDHAIAQVVPVSDEAAAAARARQDRLTKPPGALGRLEDLSVQLAAIAGACPPPVPEPAAVAVFAGDHGVLAQGVTPWPREVTAQMVAGFAAGTAAVNVLARQLGATVTVVDVGVATPVVETPNVVHRRVRSGTADLALGPAMTAGEADAALDVGAAVAAELVAGGAGLLVTGDMGIGNTTASAAIIAALTGRAAREVTGRGTGIDGASLARKVAAVERGLLRLPAAAEARTVLAEVGGLEIAALAGFIVGGAAARVPVVVDGVIAGAALLCAHRLQPLALPYVIAGHRSTEPGASAVLEELALQPVVDLGLRLGEGTGACLAVPAIVAAARLLREMATFDDAGITPS